jgi:hypothetical protein
VMKCEGKWGSLHGFETKHDGGRYIYPHISTCDVRNIISASYFKFHNLLVNTLYMMLVRHYFGASDWSLPLTISRWYFASNQARGT